MISVKNLSKNFGGIKAVNNASLVIKKGSITGLIGPNGAGKTTLFNVIAGVYPPSHGTVFLEDEDITKLPPHELFNRGLMRTFQIAHEFSSLTVRENLMMVPANQSGEKLIDIWLRPSKIKLEEEQIVKKANNVMDFLQLSALADEFAGNLSGGQKKLLELGRTMMVEPKIVFLDEVGAGVNRTLLSTIGDAILRLNRDLGYTFCMIEHDMEFIAKLCDPVIVRAEGSVLAEGSADEIKKNNSVIEAYLGTGQKNKKAIT
jgi:branched-chain amino acid transport system ATP-binding protein